MTAAWFALCIFGCFVLFCIGAALEGAARRFGWIPGLDEWEEWYL